MKTMKKKEEEAPKSTWPSDTVLEASTALLPLAFYQTKIAPTENVVRRTAPVGTSDSKELTLLDLCGTAQPHSPGKL